MSGKTEWEAMFLGNWDVSTNAVFKREQLITLLDKKLINEKEFEELARLSYNTKGEIDKKGWYDRTFSNREIHLLIELSKQ